MNEPESPMNAAPASELASLQQQVQSLQKLLQATLAVLLVSSGCFMVFLWRQQRSLSQQAQDVEARRVAKALDTEVIPFVNRFVPSLQAYAKTHPDLNPILDKYNLRQPLQGQAATGAAPAPATAAKPAAPKK